MHLLVCYIIMCFNAWIWNAQRLRGSCLIGVYCYIKNCNNLQIYEGDGLPTLICQQCCHEVDRSYKFKMKCETSDATLKQYTRKSPVNSEDEVVAQVTQYLHCYFSFVVNKVYFIFM